ncbi:class I SAM-dependent methyltransferase [Spiribacter vilamensis]|uniref:Methyltransferase family protein n=1 Tax=Spiribacter vilamensis TaxID=531306 RepID=A0A4Q8D095_9GAMM|nr:class I SAM-dependent methyltransferase [Spiribacter vilamensis]RZU98718.1 methyltransferase family protein [Spiribacter vilamensis]TVO62258.1 class I SAM-dependent methyltransferase [Spiribacter vilamensis]
MADFYSENAETLFERYNALDFEAVHAALMPLLPSTPGTALDVGAGSGRDALALAQRGWEVVAVEPARRLRELGEAYTQGQSVQWMDDQLPDLNRSCALSERFNLILLSAVWMHVPPGRRQQSLRTLADLLTPGGVLYLTLRHGPGDGERAFYPVSHNEVVDLGAREGLANINLKAQVPQPLDLQGRAAVTWETICLQRPSETDQNTDPA